MTAQSSAVARGTSTAPRHALLGFGTVVGKEFTEWVRGPKALIILGISVLGAVFMTLIPFIAEATNEAESAGLLSHDPTANVLLGWTGQTVALIAVLSTMALLSTERDRGTLAWTLTNPVSPTSVIAAKYVVALGVFVTTALLLPMIVSIALATVVYGGVPDLRVIGTFLGLFVALPAFYIALTVALGTGVKSTVGIAGIAFAVMFLPQVIGGLLPVVADLSPTSIGTWALHVAKGEPASMLTPIGWAISMVVLIVGAKLVFERQEL
ncbi:MAG: ABC transporter permease [Chloroflexota bacterium]|jgi:ABC-type transport system involved in multi-copper enzyme maturation permease subunit